MDNNVKNKHGFVKFKFYRIFLLIILLFAVIFFIQIIFGKYSSKTISIIYQPDTHSIFRPKRINIIKLGRWNFIPDTVTHPVSPHLPPPSNWVKSPNRKYIAYIDPLEWEEVGNLYVKDTITKKNIQLTHNDQNGDETPKAVIWLNDTLLLFISGYPWGTITVGGKLYIYNIKSFKKALIFDPTIKKEVVEVSVQGNHIVMRIANWNSPDYTYYTLSSRVLRLDSIMADGVIRW